MIDPNVELWFNIVVCTIVAVGILSIIVVWFYPGFCDDLDEHDEHENNSVG